MRVRGTCACASLAVLFLLLIIFATIMLQTSFFYRNDRKKILNPKLVLNMPLNFFRIAITGEIWLKVEKLGVHFGRWQKNSPMIQSILTINNWCRKVYISIFSHEIPWPMSKKKSYGAFCDDQFLPFLYHFEHISHFFGVIT